MTESSVLDVEGRPVTDPYSVRQFRGVFDATVVVPGSKSLTNRALVCAALADGSSLITGALVSDDTDAMIAGLRSLGVAIESCEGPSTAESGNTDVVVTGSGGFVVTTGADVRVEEVASSPVRVDARLSGTTSRFLLAVASLSNSPITIDGDAPLRGRPMADLLDAVGALGASVGSTDGCLPVTIESSVDRRNHVEGVTVAGSVSSQFLTALLLVAPCYPKGLTISVLGELQSVPYVAMTIEVMRHFGASVAVADDWRSFVVQPGGYVATDIAIEPDASAASYFFAAAAIAESGSSVTIRGLGTDSLQGDMRFVEVLASVGATVSMSESSTTVTSAGTLAGGEFDFSDISDTAQTLAAVAPFAASPITISGIGFIRRKETDRVAAMVAELIRCGVEATELDDGVRIIPTEPTPALISTYHDHRMAMSFAITGLRSSGIRIADPTCVAKTFPTFWSTLERLGAS